MPRLSIDSQRQPIAFPALAPLSKLTAVWLIGYNSSLRLHEMEFLLPC